MANILIGQRVVNRNREVGTILSFDGAVIRVDYGVRVAKLPHNAFEEGYLRYEDTDLQRTIDEDNAAARAEAARQAEAKRQAELKAEQDRAAIQLQLLRSHHRVAVASASVRLDPAPLILKSVRLNDRDVIASVFEQCDKDIAALHTQFKPVMHYSRYAGHTRSKFATAFLTRYDDTYVLRVFSRHDRYKRNYYEGNVTIQHSDTTEILRVLSVNGKYYCFAKNVSFAGGHCNHSSAYNAWQMKQPGHSVLLNEVVRCCDCGYLNDYVAAQGVDCTNYSRLLFGAMHNTKVEIIFKHRAFALTAYMEDVEAGLEAYTSKQIDFAARHNVLHTLPMMKKYGLVDVTVLGRLETALRPRRGGYTIYGNLHDILSRLGLDAPDVDKKLIAFLRKVDYFDATVYDDYIHELSRRAGVTLQDFFDKDYVERHDVMMLEKRVSCTEAECRAYSAVAQELSWIDREENGYYIIVPKSIEEFLDEGTQQHNCVYTGCYFELVIRRKSIVVFLRREPDVSFVTIEFDYDTFEVLQAYGKYNSPIDPDLYRYVEDLGRRLYLEKQSQQ